MFQIYKLYLDSDFSDLVRYHLVWRYDCLEPIQNLADTSHCLELKTNHPQCCWHQNWQWSVEQNETNCELANKGTIFSCCINQSQQSRNNIIKLALTLPCWRHSFTLGFFLSFSFFSFSSPLSQPFPSFSLCT